jgi:hypothetical protein
MAMNDTEHWDMPFPDLAKALGIASAHCKIEPVGHNRHSIFRCKLMEKPPFDAVQEVDRIWLNQEGLQLQQEAINYSDEMWVDLNSTHKKKNQSRSLAVSHNCKKRRITKTMVPFEIRYGLL